MLDALEAFVIPFLEAAYATVGYIGLLIVMKELLRPFDYVVYAGIAVLAGVFLWRQLRPGRRR